jgi:hypothetical protein
MRHLSSLVFPAETRSFPGRRGLKILLRAAHVLCAGVLTGGYFFDVGSATRASWLVGTIASGILILVLDLHESGTFLLQLRGLVVVVKIGLLAVLPVFAGNQAWVLAVLVVASVLVSHAPGRIRYYMALGGGRFKGAETKG